MNVSRFLKPPRREYILIALMLSAFGVDLVFPSLGIVLFASAVVAAAPTVASALHSLARRRVTIEVFNTFALVIAFVLTDARSAGFITLMLAFARLLDSFTQNRTKRALEELLALKPSKAVIEREGRLEEIAAEAVALNETVVIEAGARVPVDGVVIFGSTHVNEASVTGESRPVRKINGDHVYAGTLVETGVLKIRASGVGKNSTIERLVALMRAAEKNKSNPEKIADRFAAIFLPIVAALGAVVYLVTRNATMTAALFLVACADDMAVAIPLAVTATLGAAAKRGVIVKGGERLQALARLKTLVLDKTGTLTYGSLTVADVRLADGIDEKRFWTDLACAEKFAEHPVGHAIYRAAAEKLQTVPDPEKFETVTGRGVIATIAGAEMIIGTAEFLDSKNISHPASVSEDGRSVVFVARSDSYLGQVIVADRPRPEAARALARLKELGVSRIIMFTGDREETAERTARFLGIAEYRAGMKPEDKVLELEKLLSDGPVGMIGDGVNDAPVLSRADVGIAMGGGAAVAVEAADVVILADNLDRLPELVELSRRSMRVISSDIAIWSVSNLFGFALVLTGVAGPALAAFYNFATDFFPLINSSRLFKSKK